MNCKPGDLAVTRIPTCLDGKFCNVLRAAQPGESINGCYWPGATDSLGHAWVIEWHSPPLGRERRALFYDRYLRSIRPSEGQDETLTWKAVPAPSVMSPKPQREFT